MNKKKKITQIFAFPDELLVYRGTKCRRYPTDYHRSPRITSIAIEKGFRVITKTWDTEYRR